MPDQDDLDEIARTLNQKMYQECDVTWFKACSLRGWLRYYATTFRDYEPPEGNALERWMDGEGDASEVAHLYVEHQLCGDFPEDSVWGELSSQPGEVLWRPFDGSPVERVEHILRFNHFQGDEYSRHPDTLRTTEGRPPTEEERAWYRYARVAFFTLFPPDSASFFVIPPSCEQTPPWHVPLALLAVSRTHSGIVVYQGGLTEHDYRSVMDRD